jgi:hypothetical protein
VEERLLQFTISFTSRDDSASLTWQRPALAFSEARRALQKSPDSATEQQNNKTTTSPKIIRSSTSSAHTHLNMGAPTVDFDGITVSLCDANNHLIVSDRAGIEAQQIITVNEGELFSVCVDFGEVTGSGPGMYSVTISLSAVDEEGEHKAQSQTWCVTASFEGGVLQFKSFRLWNFTYENHTEQGFAMPKPGGK